MTAQTQFTWFILLHCTVKEKNDILFKRKNLQKHFSTAQPVSLDNLGLWAGLYLQGCSE
jgi:hypothetical protein